MISESEGVVAKENAHKGNYWRRHRLTRAVLPRSVAPEQWKAPHCNKNNSVNADNIK